MHTTEDSEIIDAPISDHRAVTVKFKFVESKSGPNYWKLNNSHLENKDFCEEIKRIFNEVVDEGDMFKMNKTIMWDYFKVKLKEFSIHFGKIKARDTRDEVHSKESQLEILNKAI